jgi:opacity protein-like surface antigen
MTVLVWNGNAHAQKLPIPQDLPYNLQLHGFFSQSWLKTTDNNVFGQSGSASGSFDSREIGVNGSMRPLTNLQISVQGLSRWAGEGSEGNFRLDYGFLDYTFFTGEASQLGVRLGRMKTPLGFYNDTRDVPFTRPSILLPQSIYFDRTRKLALAADGGHLYGEYRTDLGDFLFQGGVVAPIVDGDETEAAVFRTLQSGYLTPKTSYVGRVNYELDGGRVRLAVSATQLNVGYSPGMGDVLNGGSVRFTPVVFSAQYNAERWSLTSEYALRHLEYKNFGPSLPNMNFTGESYYFQGTYRFTPQWEGVIRYDVLHTDMNDRDGKEYAAAHLGTATRPGIPAHTRFAKDLTAGVRWNVTPELMLRAEYHYVNGTGWLSNLDNPKPSALIEDWHLFAILGSYRF